MSEELVEAAGDTSNPQRLVNALRAGYAPEAFLPALAVAAEAGWLPGLGLLWVDAARRGLPVDPVAVLRAGPAVPQPVLDDWLLEAVFAGNPGLVRAAVDLGARPDAPLLGRALHTDAFTAAAVWSAAEADVLREASREASACSFAAQLMVDAPEAATLVRLLLLAGGGEFDAASAATVLLCGPEEAWRLVRDSQQLESVVHAVRRLPRPVPMSRAAYVIAELGGLLPMRDVIALLQRCPDGSDAMLLFILSESLWGRPDLPRESRRWHGDGWRLRAMIQWRGWGRSLVWLLRTVNRGVARSSDLACVLASRDVDDETKVEVVGMVRGTLSEGWVRRPGSWSRPRVRGYLVGVAVQGGSGASVVEALLRRGVPVTARALHKGLAGCAGSVGGLEAALRAADPGLLSGSVPGERLGRTLLELVAERHSPEAVRVLLAAGAPVTDAALRSLWRRRRTRPFITGVEWGDALVELGGEAVAEAGWPITAAAAARRPDVLRCPGVIVDWTAFWGSRRAAGEFVRRCRRPGGGLAGHVGRLPARARRVLIELLV